MPPGTAGSLPSASAVGSQYGLGQRYDLEVDPSWSTSTYAQQGRSCRAPLENTVYIAMHALINIRTENIPSCFNLTELTQSCKFTYFLSVNMS